VVIAKVVVIESILLLIMWQWKKIGHCMISSRKISIAKIFNCPAYNDRKLLVAKPTMIKKFLLPIVQQSKFFHHHKFYSD